MLCLYGTTLHVNNRHVTSCTWRVIKTFADRHTRELYVTDRSKRFPPDIARRARRKLEYIDLATRLDDLKIPPGNRLHPLGRKREGQYAISINDQWRCGSRVCSVTHASSGLMHSARWIYGTPRRPLDPMSSVSNP